MSDMTCAYPPRIKEATFRLPFGLGYVVVDRESGLGGVLARLATRPAAVLRNRRTVTLLSAMTARQLADIGLTRGDVIDAADIGAFGHPLDVLQLRAKERAARAAARGERRP